MTQIYGQISIVGAGIIGIASAYYLCRNHGVSNIVLIDKGQPMEFTSAQSGENYRNWWPHPHMTAFSNRSIDLLEEIARESSNRINMNRRGYCLVTRSGDVEQLVEQLQASHDDRASEKIREHTLVGSRTYIPPIHPEWESAPNGVDILRSPTLIREVFPSYSNDVNTVVHIRRGGDISGQQLGAYMLEYLKQNGLRYIAGEVVSIERNQGFDIEIETAEKATFVQSDMILNAGGPFAAKVAKMLDVDLPVHNVLQQKIAFEDRGAAIPRDMPFTIDLDPQFIDWSDEERSLLAESKEYRWLTQEMPGSIHCRPDGGEKGTWIKLGWAFNEETASASWRPELNANFPEIVLRGAAKLNPALQQYYGQLPRQSHHYGGWYTMTQENWPLIGPMGPEGAFMNCAHSGFGTMCACAAGELAAAWIVGADLPHYGPSFSHGRYRDGDLMVSLRSADKGLL